MKTLLPAILTALMLAACVSVETETGYFPDPTSGTASDPGCNPGGVKFAVSRKYGKNVLRVNVPEHRDRIRVVAVYNGYRDNATTVSLDGNRIRLRANGRTYAPVEASSGYGENSAYYGMPGFDITGATFPVQYGSVETVEVLFLPGAFSMNGRPVKVAPYSFSYRTESGVEFNQLCG